MRRISRCLTFGVILAIWSFANPVAMPQQAALQRPTPGTIVQGEEWQAPDQVSDEQKQQFIRMLNSLPVEGEFYSEEAVDKAAPYLPVLLALTEKDIAKYDIYRFGALSRGLCNRREHRRYVVRHFAKIHHPILQLLWAAMLFDESAASREIVRFLQDALKSPRQAQLLSEILGPQFEDFKKRVLTHLDSKP